MNEIIIKKVSKNKYMAYDSFGNKAYGATKDAARNQYHLLYEIDRSPNLGTCDMSQYNIPLNFK